MSKLHDFSNMSPQDIKIFLNNHADSMESGKYFKRFDEEDTVATQSELSEASIKIAHKEAEFALVKAQFKKELNDLNQTRSEALTKLMSQGDWLEGTVYLFANHEDKMMESYDERGELLSSRRLRPEERQTNVLRMEKAAGDK